MMEVVLFIDIDKTLLPVNARATHDCTSAAQYAAHMHAKFQASCV